MSFAVWHKFVNLLLASLPLPWSARFQILLFFRSSLLRFGALPTCGGGGGDGIWGVSK